MSTTDAASGEGRSLPLPKPKGRIQLQEYALVGVVALILIVGAILEPDTFLTSDNMLNVLRQASVVGVLAIGMTFVIATGGIDLSVGSMVAAAAVAGGQLADSGSVAFVLGALAMGIVLGGINASVDRLRARRAVHRHARHVHDGPRPRAVAERQDAGLAVQPRRRPLVRQRRGDRHPVGRDRLPGRHRVRLGAAQPHAVRALRRRHRRQPRGGADRRREGAVDRLQRLRDLRHLRGLAAILVSGRLASASPIIGNLYELDAIAAVVIGGSALQGGRATIVGTFLGVITFALIFNLLTLMDLAVEIQQITKGLIILAAVLVQRKER